MNLSAFVHDSELLKTLQNDCWFINVETTVKFLKIPPGVIKFSSLDPGLIRSIAVVDLRGNKGSSLYPLHINPVDYIMQQISSSQDLYFNFCF